ncbi:hypothetical protein AKJ16_DCAP10082 [Drosera capensis]
MYDSHLGITVRFHRGRTSFSVTGSLESMPAPAQFDCFKPLSISLHNLDLHQHAASTVTYSLLRNEETQHAVRSNNGTTAAKNRETPFESALHGAGSRGCGAVAWFSFNYDLISITESAKDVLQRKH